MPSIGVCSWGWQGGVPGPCWWEGMMAQPLGKTVWGCLVKLKILHTSHNLTISSWVSLQERLTHGHRGTRARVFTAALFAAAENNPHTR